VIQVVKRIRGRGHRVKELLEKGAGEGVFPGAVLFVAKSDEILFFQEIGHLSLSPEAVPMSKDTIFDLASLTKPLATTLAIMKLAGRGHMALDQPLSDIITTCPLRDKKDLTPRLLLNHSAGFPDWKPFYLDLVKLRKEKRKSLLREWIIEEPFAYPPGKGCLYSDLGFMILEWVIEEAAGMSMASFLEQNFYRLLSLEKIFLGSKSSSMTFKKEAFAATEACPWRKELIQGEVHDENAYSLGGYSGHAGLFGDAQGLFTLVNLLREHYLGRRDDYLEMDMVKAFFKRQDMVDGCTWALGWDTPSAKDSSSGHYFSPKSVGHLGFTGTSVWVDLARDIMVIFLTNRIHPSRHNEKIRAFRPILHDLVMEELGDMK